LDYYVQQEIRTAFLLSLSVYTLFSCIIIKYAYNIYQFVNKTLSGDNFVLLFIFLYFLA